MKRRGFFGAVAGLALTPFMKVKPKTGSWGPAPSLYTVDPNPPTINHVFHSHGFVAVAYEPLSDEDRDKLVGWMEDTYGPVENMYQAIEDQLWLDGGNDE